MIAAGGPALLFTNVTGADFRLVTNLFGTPQRAELAFGERPLRLIKRIVELAETLLPPTPGKLWGARDVGRELLKVGTRRVAAGPGRRARRRATCGSTGCRRSRPGPRTAARSSRCRWSTPQHPDRQRATTSACTACRCTTRAATGMHWQIGKGGGYHYAVAEARGESLPATVFLGGPPALILSAIAPLPENVPELMLASLIAGERLPQVHGHGAASADRQRRVRADRRGARRGVRRPEGPFGDHYGYYSLQHDYPVFEVQRIAHRADAIYPATVVGKPRQEDFFIGDLLQELLSPLFPLVMPAVEQLWSYGETGYHSLAAAVVKQRYEREAMASAFRILGEGQLSLTKFLLVTDRHVDLRNFRATLEHMLARTHPETDLYVFSNLSMDTLDYTGPDGQRRVEGRLARAGRSGARAAAPVQYGSDAARRHRRARLLRRLPGGGRSGLRRRARRRGAAGRATRRLPAGRSSSSPTSRARGAQRHELPVDHVHALRAGGRHPRRRSGASSATTSRIAGRSSSTRA